MTHRKMLRSTLCGEYELRVELVDGSEYGSEDFKMVSAYNLNGDYIGNAKNTKFLCKKMGIRPELRTPGSKVCSIGFCEKEQKFFGWSHRAIFGFGIGSSVKKGDCAYTEKNILEIYASLSKEQRSRVTKADADSITVEETYYDYGPDDPNTGELIPTGKTSVSEYTINFGRGAWTAKTLEDARQMAIDFARGVS